MKDFSKYIIEKRNTLLLTQEELANYLKVDKRTIHNWENGAAPREKTAHVIKNAIEELERNPGLLREETATDPEKAALKKLVAAQEELLENFRQFVIAQLIRMEAIESVNAERIAELNLKVDQLAKSEKGITILGSKLSQELDRSKADVEDKIREIKKGLKLL
ncbi:helix-turn-helix domain-containing protein [Chitinophaga sp. NPDC101104]|uniref:helix-turn-helix domain-containing protein n=1 Tax=Chitinophaga sp. NPDC101104 TaxID=3390561 RepID=UPI003CFC1FC8